MAKGSTRFPLLANAANARVISNSVTSDVPSGSDRFGSSGDEIPSRCATPITFLRPTSSAMRMATVLIDLESASRSVIGPRY